MSADTVEFWRAAADRATDDHGKVCKELHEARARVAELEAEDARKQKMLDVCNDVHGHNVKLKSRIARAVAELEQLHWPKGSNGAARNDRALAILKGES